MILWTIVPEETIFAEQQPVPVYEEITYLGQTVMVEKLAGNQFRVVRIITTIPGHYLRSELQPGTVITYKPVVDVLSSG